MSIKISYKNSISEKIIKNYVLFANEEFKINGLNKLSLSKQSNQINTYLSTCSYRYLYNNQLVGTVPRSIGSLVEMEEL